MSQHCGTHGQPLTQFLCAKCFAEVSAGIRAGGFEAGLEAAAKLCDQLREGAPNLLIERVLLDTAGCIRAHAEEVKP